MTDAFLRVAALTHQGARRSGNEDTICVGAWVRGEPMPSARDTRHELSTPIVCLVCDGMGGHDAGEVASALAARTLSISLNGPATEGSIAKAIREVNADVFRAADGAGGRAGMGTTVAGLWFSDQGLIWFNVGDSRVYRFRDGFARQLTVDDVRTQPDGSRVGHVITQALGGAERFIEIDPHVGDEPLVMGWRYLICSDGLTDMVPIEVIEAKLALDLEAALEGLFSAAMAAGGEDNISIVLASVESAADG